MREYILPFGSERDVNIDGKIVKSVGQFVVYNYGNYYQTTVCGIDEVAHYRCVSAKEVVELLEEPYLLDEIKAIPVETMPEKGIDVSQFVKTKPVFTLTEDMFETVKFKFDSSGKVSVDEAVLSYDTCYNIYKMIKEFIKE